MQRLKDIGCAGSMYVDCILIPERIATAKENSRRLLDIKKHFKQFSGRSITLIFGVQSGRGSTSSRERRAHNIDYVNSTSGLMTLFLQRVIACEEIRVLQGVVT